MRVFEPWVVSFGLPQPYRWRDGILINTPGAALISAIYNVQAEAVQVAAHHVVSLCKRRDQRRVGVGTVMTMKGHPLSKEGVALRACIRPVANWRVPYPVIKIELSFSQWLY